ncbi:unnamed protein product [Malus baccata var. baccata]
MIGDSQSRSIITSDPGFVTNRFASSEQVVAGSVSQVDNHEKEVLTSGLCHQSTEGSGLGTRVRYCRSCKASIKGLDHHCPPTLSENLVVSTILFVILQLVRQVVFVIWHIYCVCFNNRTDEWNAMPNLLPVQGKSSQVLGSGILMTKAFFRMPGSF